jgi:PAS domain-containing protein
MYYSEVRHPGPGEIQLIDYASRIAGIAVERDRSHSALTRVFEQIEKSETLPRHIVDAIPQMIAVLNPDGTVLYVNQTVLDYTGLTTEEVMATDFRNIAFHVNLSESAPTPFQDIGGVSLAYRHFGKEVAPPVVCFQHFTGTINNFDPIHTNRLAQDRPVILVDYPVF